MKIMKKIFLIAVGLFLFNTVQIAKVYKLYFLGGQSNMVGHGKVSELPEKLKCETPHVLIFNGNSSLDNTPIDGRGIWSILKPGYGEGFRSDGKNNFYSNQFGPELTFGQRMHELEPDANIAIIKYARNGSSIDSAAASVFGCWEPDFEDSTGINQYDYFLATLRNAFSYCDIDGDGEQDTLVPIGIVWMQGESDGTATKEVAERYEYNLKRLIDLIRAALRIDDLPVVIGRISDSHNGKNENGDVWKYGNIIRKAQAEFVHQDHNAALIISTDQYKYSDPWHYDTNGYIDLGKQFANEIFKIQHNIVN